MKRTYSVAARFQCCRKANSKQSITPDQPFQCRNKNATHIFGLREVVALTQPRWNAKRYESQLVRLAAKNCRTLLRVCCKGMCRFTWLLLRVQILMVPGAPRPGIRNEPFHDLRAAPSH
jgi:hypothetical protein